MRELKCPKCGNVFTVDEADYAAILSQVRNKEFEQELSRRLDELHRQHLAEQKAAEAELQKDHQSELNKKEQELSKGHKDPVPAISAAAPADHGLIQRQVFPARSDTDHKKHPLFSFSDFFIYVRYIIFVFMPAGSRQGFGPD